MPYFPMFVNLEDKKVVVVGGGKIALRKVEKLLEFNARIHLIAPKVCEEICKLANEGKLKIYKRPFSPRDLKDAFMVVSATNSSKVNERIARLAKKKNIPCNVVDNPSLCTFVFPAVITRGDISIGISTSGKAPSLSKTLKHIIENAIPQDIDITLGNIARKR